MLLNDADAPLVTRAQHGDHIAFGQLVLRHHSSVHRTARAILGSADAEDVVQDAWLHAYMHLARFQGTAAFKTWVHAIVRNRAVDHYRSACRRRQYEGTVAPAVRTLDEWQSDDRSPEDLVLDGERRERLAAAIAALPRALRDPLELWHTGQYSYEEMARISGVAVSTIKSRIWEARQRVTQALLR